jgi:hypothetical protein
VTSWPVAAPLHGRSLLCSQLVISGPFQAPRASVTPQVHYTEGAPSPLVGPHRAPRVCEKAKVWGWGGSYHSSICPIPHERNEIEPVVVETYLALTVHPPAGREPARLTGIDP